MAGLKVVVAIVAIFATAYAGVIIDARITDEHNIDQCDPTTAIVRLYETNIFVPAGILSVTKTLTYPETGLNTNLITCLKVINTDTSNRGGYPQIVSGGVGSYDVQILLKSQWGQPLNFRVEIWADKADDGDDDGDGDGN